MFRSVATVLSMICAVCLQAGDLAPPPGSEESPAEIDPVQVTANKLAQPLSEVAGSVTVIGGQELDDRWIDGFADYLNKSPGVSYQASSPGENHITVRGMTVGDFVINYGAATYFDEAPLTSARLLSSDSGSIDLRLVDMDRVEILRGPQGTLYGANSISGVIRAISNAPDTALRESWVSAGFNTVADGAPGYELSAMTNVPVMDGDAAFRLVAYRFDDSGFIDNINAGVPDVGENEVVGMRLAFGWEPAPDLMVRAQVAMQRQDSTGLPWVRFGTDFDRPRNDFGRSLPQHDDLDLLNLHVEWLIDGLSLISVTSYSRRDNLDQTPSAFIDISDPTEGINQLYTSPSRYLSQELRLRSADTGDLRWVAGLWLSDQQIDGGQRVLDVDHAVLCDLAGEPPGCGTIYDVALLTDRQEYGLFGEMTYRFSDDWSVTAGARWFRTQDDESQVAILENPIQSGVIDYAGKDIDVDPKIAVEYRGLEDWLIYARADRGHTPGFGTLIPPVAFCGDVGAQPSVRRTTALSHELGARYTSRGFGHRLALAYYNIDWEDLQMLQVAACGFVYYVNASAANSRGFEIEYSGQIGSGWGLDAAMSYNRSELRAPTPAGGQAGDELPHSPDWLLHVGLQRDISSDRIDGFARLDLSYVGTSIANSPTVGLSNGPEEGGYTLVDLSGGIALRQGLWLRAGVRNIFDQRAPVYIYSNGADLLASVTQPRTFYTTIRYEF